MTRCPLHPHAMLPQSGFCILCAGAEQGALDRARGERTVRTKDKPPDWFEDGGAGCKER